MLRRLAQRSEGSASFAPNDPSHGAPGRAAGAPIAERIVSEPRWNRTLLLGMADGARSPLRIWIGHVRLNPDDYQANWREGFDRRRRRLGARRFVGGARGLPRPVLFRLH